AEVEALDLDDAQLALARRVLPERHQRGLVRRDVVDAHGPVAPDNLVRAVDGPFYFLVRRRGQLNVYLAGVGRHAETARLRAEEFDERLREYVLARVLLHVVEPAVPVNAPAHGRARPRRAALDEVQHAAVLRLDALDDASIAERARVRGLPAARRVEGRAVERDDGAPAGGPFDRGDDGV